MSVQQVLSNLRMAARSVAAASIDDDIIDVVLSCNAAGDNVVLQPPGQLVSIVELFLWNGVGTQSLILKDGQVPLLPLTGVPAPSGVFFGFAGTGNAHFRISPGNQFIINLGVGSQLDGFLKYRVAK